MPVSSLEQKRRNLKGSDPELYALIANFEAHKALDSFGELVSGKAVLDGHGAANLAWAESSKYHNAYHQQAKS